MPGQRQRGFCAFNYNTADKRVFRTTVALEDDIKYSRMQITKIESVFQWDKTAEIFEAFVSRLDNERRLANGVQSAVLQLIKNSIYGRLCQKIRDTCGSVT